MAARAAGGFSQVTIGETAVDFDHASREPFPPIDYSKQEGQSFDDLAELARIIKGGGAKALIELSHCGESMIKLPGSPDPIGPTDFVRNEDGVHVKGMDRGDMDTVIAHFVQCAQFMKAAGYDGVLIHAGHGWLLHQFLSGRTNKRTDEYGGTRENRAKFPVEVFKAVREALGEDFIIEMRVSGDEKMPGGMGTEETSAFCKMVEPYIDFVHVSVGVYRDPVLSGEFSSMYQPYALNADAAQVIKAAVDIPVAVVGGITGADVAERVIAEGKADIVALARPATADPKFAHKAVGGSADDIAECIRCYKCFPGELEENIDKLDQLFGCTVNPDAFFLDTDLIEQTPQSRKCVLVVGGGCGGMQAAITAHDRGHEVTLMERTGSLGGLLNFADKDAYKVDLKKYNDLLKRRVAARDIKILLNQTFEGAQDCDADVVILAIGSKPSVPLIPGIENAYQALDAYDHLEDIGQNVLMIGGGLVGCETGLSLAKMGKSVTVIEMQERLAPDSYPMHRIALLDEMEKKLTARTSLKCTKIYADGADFETADGGMEHIDADTMVYALGMAGLSAESSKLEEDMKEQGIEVYRIGDCVRAAKVFEAVREGYTAALSIL
jgi:2,4-dienoyl-CoA reductase-like NADH-dependent reductase (Old Yellow Enzyme family)/thioredoxin reductase